MSLGNWLRRRRIAKTSDHKFFFKDKGYNFEFYYKFTRDNDLTLMSFDTVNKTYREFILDDVIIRAMFEASDGQKITKDKRKVDDKSPLPDIVRDYINADFTLLRKTGDSRFANVAVLVKIGDFGKEKGKSFILRRVVYNDTLVIGMDTLAVPLNAVKKFVKTMEKYFKTERAIAQKGEK